MVSHFQIIIDPLSLRCSSSNFQNAKEAGLHFPCSVYQQYSISQEINMSQKVVIAFWQRPIQCKNCPELESRKKWTENQRLSFHHFHQFSCCRQTCDKLYKSPFKLYISFRLWRPQSSQAWIVDLASKDGAMRGEKRGEWKGIVAIFLEIFFQVIKR